MHIKNLLLTAALLCACSDDSDNMSTEPRAGTGGEDKPCTETIALLDYKLDPKDIEADSGEITLCAENKGKAPHDLAVRDASGKKLGGTKTLDPGDSDQFTVDLSAAKYDIFCTLNGHESLGMKGTLTVQ
jgi:uncharacterized cupredoxin-like copper-binding protein